MWCTVIYDKETLTRTGGWKLLNTCTGGIHLKTLMRLEEDFHIDIMKYKDMSKQQVRRYHV